LVFGSWLNVVARVLANDSTRDSRNDLSIGKSDGINGESSETRSKKAANDGGSLTGSFTTDLGSDSNGQAIVFI